MTTTRMPLHLLLPLKLPIVASPALMLAVLMALMVEAAGPATAAREGWVALALAADPMEPVRLVQEARVEATVVAVAAVAAVAGAEGLKAEVEMPAPMVPQAPGAADALAADALASAVEAAQAGVQEGRRRKTALPWSPWTRRWLECLTASERSQHRACLTFGAA